MNRNEKNAALSAYQAIFEGVSSVVVTDASGVDVNTINIVRSKFREQGVTFKVVKNTLAKLAIKGTELEVISSKLVGPVAIALKKDDPVSPAKIAVEFAKTNPKFEIKGGYVSGKLLDAKGVETLSQMKGKDELRAELLSIFKAPQREFVGVNYTMVSQFLGLLNARKDALEEA